MVLCECCLCWRGDHKKLTQLTGVLAYIQPHQGVDRNQPSPIASTTLQLRYIENNRGSRLVSNPLSLLISTLRYRLVSVFKFYMFHRTFHQFSHVHNFQCDICPAEPDHRSHFSSFDTTLPLSSFVIVQVVFMFSLCCCATLPPPPRCRRYPF